MSLVRKALLAASTNVWLRERATKAAFVRRSVSRFMPGETMDDALRAAAQLKGERITTILTRLGENITRIEEAEEVTQHYLEVLDKIAAAGLDAHVSIKPTQLGLDQDVGLCRQNLDRLIERTEQHDNFLWIDMESSPYVDPTLDLFRYGARTDAEDRHRAAGLPVSNGEGRRVAPAARQRHPNREGSVPGAAGRCLSTKVGRGRELLQVVRPADAA